VLPGEDFVIAGCEDGDLELAVSDERPRRGHPWSTWIARVDGATTAWSGSVGVVGAVAALLLPARGLREGRSLRPYTRGVAPVAVGLEWLLVGRASLSRALSLS
jgi:hypothetical protein